MAAYKTDDYPSQLDLLHRTFAHESMWPIWYEYPDRAVSRLDYMPFGAPVTLGVDTVGRFTVTDWTGETLDGLDAAEIITDDEQTLTIPEPVTQFVIQGKTAKASDGVLEFDQHDTELSDLGTLPANLKTTQSSVTVEADVVSADESGGVWTRAGGTVWTPGDDERAAFSRLLVTVDRRLRPETIVFDSRRLDPQRTRACISPPAAARWSSREPRRHGSPATTETRRHPARGQASAARSPTSGGTAGHCSATR